MTRKLLVGIAVAALVAPWAPAQGQHSHHGGHKPCHPSRQEKREAAEFARKTVTSTEPYEDPAAALSDDFVPWVDTPYKSIHHYINYANYYDWRVLDPTRPEALVYTHTITGPKLIGVMYSMEDPGRTPPDMGGCITRWHTHPQCRSAIGYSHIWEENWGDCPPGWADDGESEPMLHVWTAPMKDGPYSYEPDGKWECWPRPAPC